MIRLLTLPRKFSDHGRIVSHNITVAGIRNEDEFTLGEGSEDLLQEELPDGQRSADVAKVQRPCIKTATGVCLVDKVHIISGNLLRSRGQVVEVHIWQAFGPIGIDVWHVHPWSVRTGERVEKAFLWLVNLSDAQDVVDIIDDGQTSARNQIGRGIACVCAIGVNVDALGRARSIARDESTARDVLNGHKYIKITFRSGRIW